MTTYTTRRGVAAVALMLSSAAVAAGCGNSQAPDARADVQRRAAYCYAAATLDNTAVFTARDKQELAHEVAEARVALTAMRRNAQATLVRPVDTVATDFAAVLDAIERSGFRPGAVRPAPPPRDIEQAAHKVKASTPGTCGVRLP
ncbi:MAG: hypothetical protein LC713_04445 [Actinobacteria bacterium]|nr:hypothetical protein [Actinomycetota bacterium]